MTPFDDQVPCAAIEPDAFFPPTYGRTSRAAVEAAKAMCASCRARPRCLAEALAREEAFGIWGGTTPQERLRLRARMRNFGAVSVL